MPHRVTQHAGLAGLSPAYFGMVMATGIVSLAASMQGLPRLANVLFALNVAMYATLWVLYLIRLWRHRDAFLQDLGDHLRGAGFFTTVAASSVLGAQFLLLGNQLQMAVMLWGLAVALWLLLTYTIFTILTVKEDKPPLDQGINGGWLLAVVATQSLAVLSALLAARIDQPWKLELNFFALSMWLWGGMLYIWMMALIFYRYAFFRFQPGDLSPPYWINMGAMAISTLAGALLVHNAPDAPFLRSLLPFIKGFTIFYWATGTWWIPMLVVLAVWRHVYKRYPLRYDPLYWGAVFPLGMYSACTHELARVMDLPFLEPLPTVFLGVALLAWLGAFTGAMRQAVRVVITSATNPAWK
ncbi:C4-dicarboxylate ABC transporter [Lysobacter concretionis Ko07 = DSM 16239]|uniref:C4-dicarboxylate ABC transporter n=1 Tax=Lysobacter concretionis Ko07 = DSM 16239 TaxID=1122185 RepID=A0A0A0ET23_9GAMM|nr:MULTISPECIES: tellurite resistance/C4-dicarboxylate transporter family protein [Lysobacter]KGM52287.1 C4-dicarboxylate ABC transporter [Lysobacter concretionis Ko07 = DSM 16239]QOD91979.1 tellurite resistance/C4-dicarboxylate transporter family protein [Lysobacter sp. CW239]